MCVFFFQAEDGIRDSPVTGVQTCALPIFPEGFQRSEYVQKTGFVDLIVERKNLSEKIGSILSILLKKNSAINSVSDETSEDHRTLTKAAS